MGVGVATRANTHPAMRSPVNWALLGLVIQRPSYGYELVQRFERTFGEALELSSPSQIYTALDTLVRRSLIESAPGPNAEPSLGRQPKPNYRATAEGAHDYEQWLIQQLRKERQRSRMFAQQLAMLAPTAALRVLDCCEQECLSRARAFVPADGAGEATSEPCGLTARLVAEENRLAIDAKLAWIQYARLQLGGQGQPLAGHGQPLAHAQPLARHAQSHSPRALAGARAASASPQRS